MEGLTESKKATAMEAREMFYQKNVLTLGEVSRYTGISKSTLYKKTSKGLIPCYKPSGKTLYFDRLEVENWLKQNPVKTSEAIEQEAVNYVMLGKKKGGQR